MADRYSASTDIKVVFSFKKTGQAVSWMVELLCTLAAEVTTTCVDLGDTNVALVSSKAQLLRKSFESFSPKYVLNPGLYFHHFVFNTQLVGSTYKQNHPNGVI